MNNFFQQRCHCERVQRAKQSVQYVFGFRLILAAFQAIPEFSAKKSQIIAHAWQIASLVALARNDSRLFKKSSENHFHFIIIDRDPSVF